ncbi:YhdH/YhfP family quinone oxidoreductase [Microbulbifer thermotolerans]|uniref:Quinone oxidoreductase n=1 Tax=Microbulbifer thermotolerans TaxID=252514 RepID=A0A143HN68_MICTH|nr:YhdH/YhfP family quinone oxidoreductase [Microbulbifer thermotolerans]AMX02722.1 quinone oxidoreductase [Microbulbifer thermotolerans]MCX2779575.1 YhdH/YhfP family quinone oxidoreductase [Microbulbifer thermotolerans]MCX2782540.1 YhdH/YhfP family quinone oxidoreductase [Microbulbifer thermotolerans]MCX2794553.1 YhdH/YhfP family quinone oxidoreductase [Microbulbifer thermotolerans]MCX2801380.1 YhdH/YhfP family quinone oxidoreductase [Microbulbifer thermotolerans]
MKDTFRAVWVEEVAPGKFDQRIVERQVGDLPDHPLLLAVTHSSLNYKDALSAFGNRGVTREYPHTPGIDAVGKVIEDKSGTYAPGDELLVTGYDLGMNTCGGLAECIRIPAGWALPLPEGLSARESMILGTAGLTAGLCVEKLLEAGAKPEDGEVLVTGATGGVGSIAVALLAKLGFRVAAVTGKLESADFLTELGAWKVLDRETLAPFASKAMAKPMWAWAVDTVGGDTLFNVIKSLAYGGGVAACGMAAGAQFQANVFPFILRGISLLGVDSVELPLEKKASVWRKFAAEWQNSELLNRIAEDISLEQAPEFLARLLRGHGIGRYVVDMAL